MSAEKLLASKYPIRVTCPHCGKKIQKIGSGPKIQRITCPRCRTTIEPSDVAAAAEIAAKLGARKGKLFDSLTKLSMRKKPL